MNGISRHARTAVLAAALALLAAPPAMGDAITDWNGKIGDMVTDAKLLTPPSARVFALAHTAMYEAANAVTKRYPPSGLKIEAAPGASLDAAVAAASRATLAKLVPSQQAAVDSGYQAALAQIADGAAKSAGIAVGEQAAAAVLASRAEDNAELAQAYRPHTTPGMYVPTSTPAVVQWPLRKPWLMSSAAQFRPGPPPKLSSEIWARDYNEIKELGGKNSTRRTAEQTDIARFWEATLPPIYYGLVRSVASAPGRDATRNARFYAAVAQAMDDGLIAVFEAKYHYNFWRPVTAIRNGDIDGNDSTERDPAWVPFIDTPMHPEYPCAHCITAAAVGTVLQAEIGKGPVPALSTSSPTAKNAVRTYKSIDAFVQEVSEARILDGVHYRNSAEVGVAMGKQVGALAVAKFLARSE
jgi:hypothetical protein